MLFVRWKVFSIDVLGVIVWSNWLFGIIIIVLVVWCMFLMVFLVCWVWVNFLNVKGLVIMLIVNVFIVFVNWVIIGVGN